MTMNEIIHCSSALLCSGFLFCVIVALVAALKRSIRMNACSSELHADTDFFSLVNFQKPQTLTTTT